MGSEHIHPAMNSLGIVVQFAGSALLTMLFLLLRPHARRRLYFRTWVQAWLALTVAVGALALPHLLAGDLRFGPGGEGGTLVRALYALHLFGSSSAIAFMVAGINQFAYGTVQRRWLEVALPLLLLYTLAAIWLSSGIIDVLRWAAPPAIMGFGWCAIRLGALPSSRHAIGTQLSGSAFALLSLLSVLYLFAYSLDAAGAASVVRYRPFIDLLLHVLLGFGMVLLMMEHAKREVDAANAELKVAHSAMRRAALYDSLTGCFNRRAFDEGVGLENARGGFGAVMMFDLDDLKDVNDAYGHAAGDALLRHLTESLRSELRPSDKLYRWGGDEFLMLLPGADEVRARSRLQTVLRDVAVLRLGPSEEPVRLNVSMGSAGYASAEDIASAIDVADAMMYREKTRKKALRAV